MEESYLQIAVIQGTADVKGQFSQEEVSKTVVFCFRAFRPISPDDREAILQKMAAFGINDVTFETKAKLDGFEAALTSDELQILNTIRGRKMLRSEDSLNINKLTFGNINGLRLNLKRGDLGLVAATDDTGGQKLEVDALSKMIGEKAIMKSMSKKKVPERGAVSHQVVEG